MKIKEITNRTSNIAWSPSLQYPIYLAAGTAAQQLDATFSTTAALEIYRLDPADPSPAMTLVGSVASSHRFHKLAWGGHGVTSEEHPAGVVVTGTDTGEIQLWDCHRLINKEEPLITKSDKHSGPVGALDFNPFQANLLASGSTESEIYIWDLNNPSSPMTPGSKAQPLDDVSCVSWNRQVQHILGSTSPCGRCVVWDLRKNEPIIKVSDHGDRMRCKEIQWHPDVATQLLLASEDDRSPVIQMWDLRFATSPLKVLENHQRGVLSISWCSKDPDLLLSCGKDDRVLCWNPNSSVPGGEVVYELPVSQQWLFDTQWCPRNPSVVSCASFDGNIGLYSLLGPDIHVDTQSQRIAESFPGSDAFGIPGGTAKPHKAPVTIPLKKPPKWLQRPVGATFSFGGKLVMFDNPEPKPSPTGAARPHTPHRVYVSQVVTEVDLVKRSTELEATLQTNSFTEYCDKKRLDCLSELDRNVWSFLKVNFEKDFKTNFLKLLGYDKLELKRQFGPFTGRPVEGMVNGGISASELVEKMQHLGSETSSPERQSSPSAYPPVGSKTPDSVDSGAAAFDVIANVGASTDVDSQPSSDIDTFYAIPVQRNDVEGMVSKAVISGDFESAVEMCVQDDRWADAIVLSIAAGSDLLARTQQRYFKRSATNLSRLISSVVSDDWADVANYCLIENWKEALATLVTYATPDEFPQLCDVLGQRLEEHGGDLGLNACLCYICAGNIDKLVECWTKRQPIADSPLALQDLLEKVIVLEKAVERTRGEAVVSAGPILADKITLYAEILASQGSLSTALNYLTHAPEKESVALLRDRLYKALGDSSLGVKHLAPVSETYRQSDTTNNLMSKQQQYQQKQTPYSQYSTRAIQPIQPFMTNSLRGGGGMPTPSSGGQTYNTNPSLQTNTNPTVPNSYPYQHHQTDDTISTPPTTLGGGFTPAQQMYGGVATAPPNLYYPAAYASTGHTEPQTTPYTQGGPSDEPSARPTCNMFSRSGSGSLSSRYPANPIVPTTPAYHESSFGGVYDQSQVARRPSGTTPSYSVGSQPAGYGTGPSTAAGPTLPPLVPAADKHLGAWNDPPPLKHKDRQTFTPPPPITQPIVGAVDPMMTAPPLPGQVSHDPYSQPPTSAHHQQVTEAVPAMEPVQPQLPIPSQHRILVDVLEDLVKRCNASSSSAQVKRKLDDVHRRLNILYDKLRTEGVSGRIIEVLHSMVTYMQQRDYYNALNLHTQLVANENFAEIGGFMPGLKVLIQICSQLQV